MKRPEFIARQAGNPTGIIGRILGRIMAKETVEENVRALELLKLQPADDVLEIGCGHGATLNAASYLAHEGFIAGLDISDVMNRLASKKNSAQLKSGTMEIRHGTSDEIPYEDNRFNKALAVHTLYFWKEPRDHFDEVFRVLAPEGLFLLCFRSAEDPGFAQSFPETVYHIRKAEDVLAAMRQSGFSIVSANTEPTSRGDLVFALGQKP